MSCPQVPIQTILGSECIGDSLPKIVDNFENLGNAACDLYTKVQGISSIQTQDSSNLLTLINQLSSDMQNIGNYPYLEYAWSTAPNEPTQQLTGPDTEHTLNITTLIKDTDGIAYIGPETDSNGNPIENKIRLFPGKYQIYGEAVFGSNVNFVVIMALKNLTKNKYETAGNIDYVTYSKTQMQTVVKVDTVGGEEFSITAIANANIAVSNYTLNTFYSNSIPGYSRRVMLQISKIG